MANIKPNGRIPPDNVKNLQPLTPEELKQWGLGRGIDITKRAPWTEKMSVQVRDIEDVMQTEEGGLSKDYYEVVNNMMVHSQARAVLQTPDVPLNIDVDEEYARTDDTTTTKYLVGVKVKNRRISFTHSLPKLPVKEKRKAKALVEMFKSETYTATTALESRICKWLIERLQYDCEIHVSMETPLNKLLCDMEINENGRDVKLIDSDIVKVYIEEFIHDLGVTHYVSSIDLGGSRFRILSEKQFKAYFSSGKTASHNFQPLEEMEEREKQLQFGIFKPYLPECKMIGKITREDDKEVVQPMNEAVISCEIQPISNLVENPFLHVVVKEVVKEFIEKVIQRRQYYIQCLKLPDDQSENFLKVNEEKNIVLTSTKGEATEFTISTVNESVHCHKLVNEFCLTSSLGNQHLTLEYKINVGVSSLICRRCSCPCCRRSSDPIMKPKLNYQQTRLLLKRRSDYRIPCSTNEWIKGSEACYIQCFHPQVTQFLCVKDETKKVQIAGSAAMGGSQFFMLFQVHPVVQQPPEPPVVKCKVGADLGYILCVLDHQLENIHQELRGFGSMCYMNATIQCLRVVPELLRALDDYETPDRERIKSSQRQDLHPAALTTALKSFYYCWEKDIDAVSTLLFHTLCAVRPEEAGINNADECWLTLMQNLSKTLKLANCPDNTEANNFINHYFGVETTYTTHNGPNVHHTKVEKHTEIFCPNSEDKNIDLEMALKEKMKDKNVSEDENELRQTSKLSRLPVYLKLTLNRVHDNTKILRNIEYPMALDMSQFCTDELKQSFKESPISGRYKLLAVITYEGESIENGHYIAWIFQNDTWTKYEHNDKMEEILEKSRGKKYGYTFLYRNDTQ